MKLKRHSAWRGGHSQYRRAGLCVLTRSTDQLAEWANSNRRAGETFADMIVGIDRAARGYRALAALLDQSVSRAKVAICIRDDAIELLTAARIVDGANGGRHG